MRDTFAWLRNDRRRLYDALEEVAFVAENCTGCPDCSEAISDIAEKAIRNQRAFLRARGQDDKPRWSRR